MSKIKNTIYKIRNIIVNDEELDTNWKKTLSLFFFTISGIMCFFSYKKELFGIVSITISFTPSLISTIIGIFLITPLYLRKILKWKTSIYSIISFILILLVFSSFVQLAIGGNKLGNITYLLIGISISLSWLGIKPVAGFCWVLVIAAAIVSIITKNYVLGFNGFIYICSGFLGLVLHSELSPGDLIEGIKAEYSNSYLNKIKSDVEEAKKNIF